MYTYFYQISQNDRYTYRYSAYIILKKKRRKTNW